MRHLRLNLAKDLARHLRGGHPWVFGKALERPPKLPAGAIVDVTTGNRFVARGYFDPTSPIAVRVLTRDENERIDLHFFRRRIQAAIDLRRKFLRGAQTDAFRIVHGEADGLPGVVVDRYGQFAVLKLYSAGLTPHREALVEALCGASPEIDGVLGRDEVGRDDGAGDETPGRGRCLAGKAPPDPLLIHEDGMGIWVDVYRGQKTGFFLDQRENRALVRSLSGGMEVLNCFSYTGGFSVAAARGGAVRTVSVDTDEDALSLARRNFSENALEPTEHEFVRADVFRAIDGYRESARAFDFVILDPPAFAKSQRAVEAAIDGYASLNRTALGLVRDGGLLATASCSARVSSEQFFQAVRQAATKAGVDLQLLYERYQPADHPVAAAFPEGRYLKFYVFRCSRLASSRSSERRKE
jgi:23S rRNA (cytosine1962-C5)-methyltransferase